MTDDDPTSVNVAPTLSVAESAGTVSFNVTLLRPAEGPVTVDIAAVSTGSAAGAGVDYTFGVSSLTFAPKETFRTVTFTVNDDNIAEQPETFRVELSNAVGAPLGAYTHRLWLSTMRKRSVSSARPWSR